VFAFIGFISAVFWIKTIAAEIVNLLQVGVELVLCGSKNLVGCLVCQWCVE
jgi:hypothetical protein